MSTTNALTLLLPIVLIVVVAAAVYRPVGKGWLGAIVAGLVGSWIGGLLFGGVGPDIGGIAIIPALLGAATVAFLARRVSSPEKRAGRHAKETSMAVPDVFQRVENEYFRLKGQLAAGRLTTEQFEAALSGLMVEHKGHYWTIGAESGQWYRHDGQTWHEATPPAD